MDMGIEKFIPKSNESFYDLIQIIEALLNKDKSAEDRAGRWPFSAFATIGLGALILFFALALFLLIQKG